MFSLPENSYVPTNPNDSYEGTGTNGNSAAKTFYNDFWDNGPNEGDVLKFWQPTKINEAFELADNEEIFDDVDEKWLEFYNNNRAASKFPVSWIQNNKSTSGLHISAKNYGLHQTGSFARLHLGENVGDYPCVTKIFYDISYFTNGNWTPENLPSASKFWVERNLTTNYSLYDLIEMNQLSTIEEFYNR